MGPFSSIRVLELTDAQADFCGRMLADFGATVTKVEPPGGSLSRTLPPLARHGPAAGTSLLWWSYNLGKRGITLDLNDAADRAAFLALAGESDILVESRPPGELDALGLGYAALAARNPGLIVVSVSPRGRGGPKSGYLGEDLTALASGGLMFITGDEDRPPVAVGTPQSYPQAGAQAAVAALFAYRQRQHTGRGQHIDLSAQEAMVATLNNTQQQWYETARKVHRARAVPKAGALHLTVREIYPCKDGHVAWRVFVGPRAARMAAMLDWMREDGLGASLGGIDFVRTTFDQIDQKVLDGWQAEIAAFFALHTKAELFEWAVRNGVMLYPLGSPADLLNEPHLAERHAFVEIDDPRLGPVRVPRSPVKAVGIEATPGGPPPWTPEAAANRTQLVGAESGSTNC